MVINENNDIVLTKEETYRMMCSFMHPPEDLVRKREKFFSNGDDIEIAKKPDGSFSALVNIDFNL